MRAYITRYATTTRASRVDAPSRRIARWDRLVDLDETPRFVFTNPTNKYIGLAMDDAYEVRDILGNVKSAGTLDDEESLVLKTEGFVKGTSQRTWEGVPELKIIGFHMGLPEFQWALECTKHINSFVSLSQATFNTQREPLGPRVRVQSELVRPEHPVRIKTIFDERIYGAGCGVIDKNRRMTVAMRDGRFIVFDGNRAANGEKGVRLINTHIRVDAYDMSSFDSGYALLEVANTRNVARSRGDLERQLAVSARRIEQWYQKEPDPWTTRVVFLDLQGRELWRHVVPFEVLQPPIDGGNGRVYVMGMGAAAFQDGKLLFSVTSDVPMFGTAFNDEHLAIAIGQELRIVDRDSKIVQKFTTAEHEAITTPPAIGSDGSVWVGTSKGLYVAR